MNELFLSTSDVNFSNDLADVVKLYFPSTLVFQNVENTIPDIVHQSEQKDGIRTDTCVYKDVSYSKQLPLDSNLSSIEIKRFSKRNAKQAVYFCLKKYFGIELPWGALTGIRPTKLAYELQSNEGRCFQSVFADEFDVTPDKIKLVQDILTQQVRLRNADEDAVDIYVGIPFCVSRCSYCSFTSGEIDEMRQYVQPYLAKLATEINFVKDLISQRNLRLRNVYFGGGTPTSITAKQLEELLALFSDMKIEEFTVEAGRPDTIDSDKLQVFKDYGVNRISINPQTFNQSTLDLIGRKHSVQDIYDKYQLASKYGFVVNMDLIAGLPSESFDMFNFSVDEAIRLSPDNVTVHTLALKKGSVLKEHNNADTPETIVSQMIDYAHDALYNNGYNPYYMYRQKYVAANLENVGFCKPNTQCKYNVDIMEETTSILACGCNAISKRVFLSQNRIERQANPKDLPTYIGRHDDFLHQKRKLFLDC